MTSMFAETPLVRRLDRRLDEAIFEDLATEMELFSTKDEANGRKRFRTWATARIRQLPRGHPGRALLLGRKGKLKSNLHAGHQTSPTGFGPRTYAHFAVHERRANIKNQTKPIKIRWVDLGNGVEVPIESTETLNFLIGRARRERDLATPARRTEWAKLVGRLEAACSLGHKRGKRLLAREGEWFIELDQDVVAAPTRSAPWRDRQPIARY
jgi:hypothetical protein